VKSLRIDTTPLRSSRDFRLLLGAGGVFYLGQMVTYVVLPAQMYQLTGSNAAVGALGAAEVVPLVVFGLWGGALADHVDRRRMLVWCGVAQVVITAALVANAAVARPQTWLLYVLGALAATAGALQRPSREALLPRVVSRSELPAAVSMNQLVMQAAMLVGPALAGLLLATVGTVWAYSVDLAGLVVATALTARLGAYPHAGETERPSLRGVAAGVRYAVGRRDLLGTYVVDLAAMTLAYPVAVFPAWAADVLHRPGALGLLYVAGSVGGLAATITSGWTAHVRHRGRAIVLAAACWGGATALAGATGALWLVLVALVVAGAADSTSGLFRGVVWHETIPDAYRGRLAGVEMLSYSLGPLAGQVRAGLVADATTVRTSIVSGGIMCVVGVALVTVLLPAFWRYDARRDPALAAG
jgi:MFS family permease